MYRLRSRWLPLALLSTGLCVSLNAVDGVVLISQVQALAGNVTPGDAPGFPVTISVLGSYRLSGNLTVPDANSVAILITADNVSLDLNGFSIIGPTVCTGTPAVTSCTPTGSGIGVQSSKSSISVFNGSIRGMGDAGIAIDGAGAIIDRVTAFSNGNAGFELHGGRLTGNTATSNRVGFQADNSTLTGNTAIGNGGGIECNQCTVSGNTANSNGVGFVIFCPSAVIGNTAFGSVVSNNLFIVGAGCAVANNAAP
jgi:parallel beta-helix repeat protein